MRAIVVVPTCREQCIQEFLEAWAPDFADREDRTVQVFVVEDHPELTFDLDWRQCKRFSHRDIERDLGEDAWIVPRGTDCVRSYGIWKAWREQPDMIVVMDDDVRPTHFAFIGEHWAHLKRTTDTSIAWTSTIKGAKPRGLPYRNQERGWPIALNHGLWTKNADLDAATQLARMDLADPLLLNQIIPAGQYFPMSGMNVAFRPDLAPALYFGLQGPAYPFDRFGDIWAGLIVKRICDHLGLGVRSGTPHVRHERASDVWANLRKEAPGLAVNEWLWLCVDKVRLTGATVGACYREMAEGLEVEGAYWDKLRRAMGVWAGLFQ